MTRTQRIRTALRLSGIAFRRRQMNEARAVAQRPLSTLPWYLKKPTYNPWTDGNTTLAVHVYFTARQAFYEAKASARAMLASGEA